MKLTVAAVLASWMPSLGYALVGINWNLPNVPPSGHKNVTFPFDISGSPHVTGFYFAQQFQFIGQNDVGYTGLQPRPDANGAPVIHAVFSSFIPGTTTSDDNCHPGADGGSGVSCAVDVNSPYDHSYSSEIVNVGGTTWTGTLVDDKTYERFHIGTWTLPSGTQGIRDRQVGFVEYYPWNSVEIHSCESLPYTKVTFGTLASNAGSLSDAYEYGDCVGKVAFRSSRDAKGVTVEVGKR